MSKSSYPWIIAGILLIAYAGGHLLGLLLAIVAAGAVYLTSLRTHPRTRHTGFRGCGGTGEVKSALFPWVFHRCPRCQGGRIIRAGAGQFGSEAIRSEQARVKTARANARQNRSWR